MILTDEQLKEIAARAEAFEQDRSMLAAMKFAQECSSDIPALLAHIEHQRRALEIKELQICALADKLSFHGHLPCNENGDCPQTDSGTCTNGTNGDCWLDWSSAHALSATKESANA